MKTFILELKRLPILSIYYTSIYQFMVHRQYFECVIFLVVSAEKKDKLHNKPTVSVGYLFFNLMKAVSKHNDYSM